MSEDLASARNGGEVYTASCHDARHPPSAIIEGDDSTFWQTTGNYPQEFILQLSCKAHVTRITTKTTNVKNLVVERCQASGPNQWEKVIDVMVDDQGDGRLQVETNSLASKEANFLKFKVMSGYGDCASVHNVQVDGRA